MMLDQKSWIYGKLSTDPALLAAVGTGIGTLYPSAFNLLPQVVYEESLQGNGTFLDNQAFSARGEITVHVFTAWTVSTQAIAALVDSVMSGLLYTLMMTRDMDEPMQKVRHKVLVYSRAQIVLEDLV